MSPTRFKLAFGLATLLAGTSIAHAIPLNLVAAEPGTLGPQSASAPCIIAGTQCQNPDGFGFTNFVQGGQPPSDFDENSPEYLISDFPFLTFDIAIDVNTNSAASETLDSFSVFVDGAEIYTFTGPSLIGDASNAGNGFGDWLLTSIDLSEFASDAIVHIQRRMERRRRGSRIVLPCSGGYTSARGGAWHADPDGSRPAGPWSPTAAAK